MKDKTFISIFRGENLNKLQQQNIAYLEKSPDMVNISAKVVSMYPKLLPVIKQAKIVSMFS